MLKAALIGLFAIFINAIAFAQTASVVSPNQKVRIDLIGSQKNNEGAWFLKAIYNIDGKSHEAIPQIALGIVRSDQEFSNRLKLLKANKPRLIVEQYTALHGKRSQRSNLGNEVVFAFENPGGARMHLIVRAYNDGIAFRYEFPEKNGIFKVHDELKIGRAHV